MGMDRFEIIFFSCFKYLACLKEGLVVEAGLELALLKNKEEL
jgi:hypothetical protein